MLRANHKNTPLDYDRAKNLRYQSSPFEHMLWRELRLLYKRTGIKFRRQQPISPYIADFACMKAKLIIELDGHSHDTRQEYDRKRDAYLRQLGFEVLRFDNNDVATNLESVVMTIVQRAKELSNNPSPLAGEDRKS